MGTVLSRGAVLLWLARAQCQCMSKMCNPFNIGLKLPSVNEALWNRMPGVGISTEGEACWLLSLLCLSKLVFGLDLVTYNYVT